MTRSEITTPEALESERLTDAALRPSRLDEFVGQAKVKESLQIAIDAAKQRKEPLDHVLFFGPPGLGKTTLALLMAKELDVNIRTTSGPVLERPGDLVGMLTSDRKSTRLNSSHVEISYAVFCWKKKRSGCPGTRRAARRRSARRPRVPHSDDRSVRARRRSRR